MVVVVEDESVAAGVPHRERCLHQALRGIHSFSSLYALAFYASSHNGTFSRASFTTIHIHSHDDEMVEHTNVFRYISGYSDETGCKLGKPGY